MMSRLLEDEEVVGGRVIVDMNRSVRANAVVGRLRNRWVVELE